MIIEKLSDFQDAPNHEAFVRAELWYGVNFEMVNGLADFFVRRTGALYFNIEFVIKHRDIVLADFMYYMNWDQKRIEKESKQLDELIQDATTFYEEEF